MHMGEGRYRRTDFFRLKEFKTQIDHRLMVVNLIALCNGVYYIGFFGGTTFQ